MVTQRPNTTSWMLFCLAIAAVVGALAFILGRATPPNPELVNENPVPNPVVIPSNHIACLNDEAIQKDIDTIGIYNDQGKLIGDVYDEDKVIEDISIPHGTVVELVTPSSENNLASMHPVLKIPMVEVRVDILDSEKGTSAQVTGWVEEQYIKNGQECSLKLG